MWHALLFLDFEGTAEFDLQVPACSIFKIYLKRALKQRQHVLSSEAPSVLLFTEEAEPCWLLQIAIKISWVKFPQGQ